jgi:hypothetical protein
MSLHRISTWLALAALTATSLLGAARKPHIVVLGAAKRVHYSVAGDPAGAAPGENELRIRALIVDGALKEWTTGDAHDITDRSFVVRRAVKLNDALPSDVSPKVPAQAAKPTRISDPWVWQRGPWMLVDRATGHITPLKLPDYDPGVSQVSWFRDYAAYCGLTPSGKGLYALVSQVAVRKPLLSRKLATFDRENHLSPVCGQPEWQREPLRITFHPAGRDPESFNLVPGSVALVEDAADEAESGPQEEKSPQPSGK